MKLKAGDIVSFFSGRKKQYGVIQETDEKTALVYAFATDKTRDLPFTALTYVPPVCITEEQLGALARCELKWSDIIGESEGVLPFSAETPYAVTLTDLLQALKAISASSDDNAVIRSEWFSPVFFFLPEDDCILLPDEEEEEKKAPLPGLPGRGEKLLSLSDRIDSLLLPDAPPLREQAGALIEEIEHFLEDETRPVEQRRYTEQEKEAFLHRFEDDIELKRADERTRALYRKFVEELCEQDNAFALHQKGYGCYGGDPVFDCDWNVSRDCISRLFEKTGDPAYANTLGYIAYYGRCWDGVPQYEEAFRYFSIGAAGGFYESRYKLADMFASGKGVPENKQIAASILSELYRENKKYMLEGLFNCKFADIAFRMGTYCENGTFPDASLYDVRAYYLQADFAIRQRLPYDNYGDLSVADHIRKALLRSLSDNTIPKPAKTCRVFLSFLLQDYLKQYRRLQMHVKELSGGDLRLTIRLLPSAEDRYPPKLFLTVPDAGFCGMLEKLRIRVHREEWIPGAIPQEAVVFDNIIGSTFYLGDDPVADIHGEMRFTSPNKKGTRTLRLASVTFQPGGKQYDYILEDDDIAIADRVIVLTDRGETEVTVVAIHEKAEWELALPIGKYKKIIRKAEEA